MASPKPSRNNHLSHCDNSIISRPRCSPKVSPNRDRGLWLRGAVFQCRVRVPWDLVAVLGSERINRSLGTSCRREAKRALRAKAHELDRYFDDVRQNGAATLSVGVGPQHAAARNELTLRQAYEMFLSDASTARSDKTLLAYRTVSQTVMDILGGDVPLRSITRPQCRDLLTKLAMVPLHARKRWPDRSALEAISLSEGQHFQTMSPAHLNGHMNKFSSLLNWATKEELIARNPALGLRIHDPVPPRDKRRPFSVEQLRKIFMAPIFRGCVDDENGYAVPGSNRPTRGRYWVPIIGLHSGLRLNEACQLDTADVRMVEGHLCFIITTASEHGADDKRLKTLSSERIVPVHPVLLDLGFAAYVRARRSANDMKLFPELPSRHGLYSHLFSRWFARFLVSCGAAAERTCYHSFRHSFRDACRAARIDRDIVMALGGWSSASDSSGSVSDSYGRGHSPAALFQSISLVRYEGIEWSRLADSP
jgi:integrase